MLRLSILFPLLLRLVPPSSCTSTSSTRLRPASSSHHHPTSSRGFNDGGGEDGEVEVEAEKNIEVLTERPVIGVLTQPKFTETDNGTEAKADVEYYYVAASYLKWLEAGGARAVPIHYTATDEEVEEIFRQVNGILFPGGGSPLPSSVRKIWDLAREANDGGDIFPLWGTCLGFEYLTMLASDRGEDILQTGFDSENISLPLLYTDSAGTSRMFPTDHIRDLAAFPNNVTMNMHNHGIEPDVFASDHGLSSTFTILATNTDRTGRPFVSAMESSHYPFYGTQSHPEKNGFEYGTYPGTDIPVESIDHSDGAVEWSIVLSRFFVSEARRNGHVYSDVNGHPMVWTYEMRRGTRFEMILVVPPPQSSAPMSMSTQADSGRKSRETQLGVPFEQH